LYLRFASKQKQAGFFTLRSLPAERRSPSSRSCPALATAPRSGFSCAARACRRIAGPRTPTCPAMALAYGLKKPPTAEELSEIAEGWHPYRTWVAACSFRGCASLFISLPFLSKSSEAKGELRKDEP
jgi:hypothetical protein